MGEERGFLYMDMDNFKLYNDLYGEQTGDRILQWCAKRFLDNVENGEVFRVGSNEFLVSVPETGREPLVALAEKLTRAVQENATNKPQVMQPITFSVGGMVSRSGSGCAGIVPAVQAGGLLCEA